ncbi:sugar phosphate isomerase/epimerase family protein [Gluconacetobacter sacchari]|uniref:sugar phosphate isomerase/epimerase family protein n=1 Tax=Gluconacetobacter sacchari TaxID=92759 RepID=UPI0039B4E502
MSAHLMSLNTATVREQMSLRQCIDACARFGIAGISPWRDGVAAMGVDKAARAIRDAGLAVSGLCRGGMFTAGVGAAGRQAALDDNRRAIDEAAALGASCLVMVCGGLAPDSKDLSVARARVQDGLMAILPHARAAGVPLALEPLHPMTCADRSVLSTLGQALDLCDALGEGAGVALDVYHVWWDPDLSAQIRRAGTRILAFHVCDWLMPTTDTVFDRGMPGDGVIEIRAIHDQVTAAGYRGLTEVEILSHAWWTRDADHVIATCIDRVAAYC